MLADDQKNKLYLSGCLPEKNPIFFSEFEAVLKKCHIPFDLFPNTKDIWAIDFMPVQVSADKFIQFKYNPDYLQDKEWIDSIPDVDLICDTIDLERTKSEIVLDGGNVVRSSDSVIMCDKIFSENPDIPQKKLTNMLRDLFEVNNLWFVPKQPYDFTGHADGMIRFLDNKTLLVNDYSRESKKFQREFRNALAKTNLNIFEIPYNPYGNKSNEQANGIYINYLQMENVVIFPVYGMEEDEQVLRQFQNLFVGKSIELIDCNEIANRGGVLNCISWTIQQERAV